MLKLWPELLYKIINRSLQDFVLATNQIVFKTNYTIKSNNTFIWEWNKNIFDINIKDIHKNIKH